MAFIVNFNPFKNFFLLLILALFTVGCTSKPEDDYLYRIIDPDDWEKYGYADSKGETVIPLGKYGICYTDTLKNFAVVLIDRKGFFGIDRNEEILFQVYPFDNGPDDPQEGLFRIIEDGKIGYANLEGEIVIKPQYGCAHPFKNGKAEVGLQCISIPDGEHSYWETDKWITIDKRGERID